jgi:ATP-dependent exoDNAse (exonuclease V) beta subunit
VNLTQEQLAAASSDGSRLAIIAAAGSGKTSVLTSRYLHHVVEHGIRPDQILTITFTRKAAAEMKMRIVEALIAAGMPDEAQVAETGPIQTIHSFCERLLRENSMAAGLDPEFEILAESQSRRISDEAIRKAVMHAYEEGGPEVDLLRKLAGQGIYQGPGGVDDRISAALNRLLDNLRGLGLSSSDVARLHGSAESVLEAWIEMAVEAVDPDLLPVVMANPIEARPKALIDLLKAARKQKPQWLKYQPIEDLMRQAEESAALARLAADAWENLDDEMRRIQKFDFTMLESLAVSLASNNPEVQDRLKHQYRAILVDESQDVNPMQHRLIQSMGIERQMLVGDPQQSIYSFRQADRELFVQTSKAFETLRLSKNFRSQPGILSFVDEYFSRTWSNDYAPMMVEETTDSPFGSTGPKDFTGVELWEMAAKDSHQAVEWLQDLLKEGAALKDIAFLVRTSRSALALAEEMRRKEIPHRIAGGSEQFFARLEIRDLANALQSICSPSDRFAQLAVMRSPLAGLSLDSVIRLSAEPDPLGALRSFDPGDAGEAGKIKAYLAWRASLPDDADRLPAWELLAHILAQSPCLEEAAKRANGPQVTANIRKLLKIASENPELDGIELAEQIREIQVMRHREGDAPADDDDADVVTIMTIHKSKGLEFDTVILPDTVERSWNLKQDAFVSSKNGLCACKFGEAGGLGYDMLKSMSKDVNDAESLRVLYVAMTRAKNRLCIAVPGAPDLRTDGGKICRAMNFPDTELKGVKVRRSIPDARVD